MHLHSPDDDNDAIKDVVRVPQVLKETKCREFEDHLQCEHTGEDDVADLQHIGEFIRLMKQEERGWEPDRGEEMSIYTTTFTDTQLL